MHRMPSSGVDQATPTDARVLRYVNCNTTQNCNVMYNSAIYSLGCYWTCGILDENSEYIPCDSQGPTCEFNLQPLTVRALHVPRALLMCAFLMRSAGGGGVVDLSVQRHRHRFHGRVISRIAIA